MRIEVDKPGAPSRRKTRRWLSLPGLIGVVISLTLVLLSLAVGAIVGVRAKESGTERYLRFLMESSLATRVVDPALQTAKATILDHENVLLNAAKGLAASNEVDRLIIDVKHVDWQRIAYKREQAIAIGILFTDTSDYVPADVTLNGKTVKAKIRLKGDLPHHWVGEKWSLRINVKGTDAALMGLTDFAINNPTARELIDEWIALAALRHEGVLTVPYHFVDVTINGERKGIYGLEGYFDHRMIEQQRQTAGPIVRFDENLKWAEFAALHSDEVEYGAFSSSPIDGFAENSAHGSDFERAISMLEGFRRGQLRTSEVFDVQRLAMFIAMKDLFASEELDWNDFRFFYNPMNSLLEPIGFNMHVGKHIDSLFCFAGGIKHKRLDWVERPDSMAQLVFSDPVFFTAYAHALQKVSAQGYVEELFRDIDSDLQRELSALYRDYPYVTSPMPSLLEAQKVIRRAISPQRAIHAYHNATSNGAIELLASNAQSLPVELLGVTHEQFKAMIPFSSPVVLGPKTIEHNMEYQPASFRIPDGITWDDATMIGGLIVHYRILGMTEDKTVAVYPWRPESEAVIARDFLLQPEPIDGLPWLTFDKDAKSVTLKPGDWKVERDVVVPAGNTVFAGPGVHLDLTAGAKFISFSPLQFRGDEDHPIRIDSTDQTGQGLVVLDAHEESFFSHCIFEHLSYPRENGWSVTGCILFYESPLVMEDCRLSHSHAEDLLNVKRSRFTLTRVLFTDSQSDAFDADFSDGAFIQCAFERCGNDAIDISGSRVTVNGLRVDGTHDKGLNAGEDSELIADDVTINHAEIGLGSKDLSRLRATNVRITDSRVGLTAYQKKPEFGVGWMQVSGISMSNVERPYLPEEGSTMIVDGRVIPAAMKDVKSILYGVEYGVNSKNTR